MSQRIEIAQTGGPEVMKRVDRDLPAFEPKILSEKGSLFFTRPSLMHYAATRDELLDMAGDLFAVVESGAHGNVHNLYPAFVLQPARLFYGGDTIYGMPDGPDILYAATCVIARPANVSYPCHAACHAAISAAGLLR